MRKSLSQTTGIHDTLVNEFDDESLDLNISFNSSGIYLDKDRCNTEIDLLELHHSHISRSLLLDQDI